MTQPRIDRRRHLLAYRARAGISGQLDSCICTWPLDKAENGTEHDERCPAHTMILRCSGAITDPPPTQAELDAGAAVIAAMNDYADSIKRSTDA